MEPYILTAEDIARLTEQGFDTRGVAPGVEATAREAEVLRGPVSTADIPTPERLPYDPSSDPSAVMPVNSTTPAPVTFVNEDGTRSTAPSPADIPQSIPTAAPSATMVAPNQPQPQNQPSGIAGLLGGIFPTVAGGGFAGQMQPQAQNIDPFEGLSRNQRMMLGFAALRDAAASLNGRDTDFFNQQLGTYEAARERERLRIQGIQANRANILAGLEPVFREINRLQEAGLEVPQYLRDIVNASLTAGGFEAQGLPGATPAAAATAAAAATTPATAPSATPTLTRTEELRQQNAADEQLLRQATSEQAREDIQARIDSRNAEIAGIEQTETAAATAETLTLPEVDAAMSYLVSGMDEDGNPVFNASLVTPAGRWLAGVTQTVPYQNFVGAIETLKTGVLLDALENASVGALSDGERDALSAAQGALDPSNPAGTYRALRRIQEISRQSIERRNRAAGIEPSSTDNPDILDWN